MEIVERSEHVAEHDADGACTVAVYGCPVAVTFDGKCGIVLKTVGGALGRHGGEVGLLPVEADAVARPCALEGSGAGIVGQDDSYAHLVAAVVLCIDIAFGLYHGMVRTGFVVVDGRHVGEHDAEGAVGGNVAAFGGVAEPAVLVEFHGVFVAVYRRFAHVAYFEGEISAFAHLDLFRSFEQRSLEVAARRLLDGKVVEGSDAFPCLHTHTLEGNAHESLVLPAREVVGMSVPARRFGVHGQFEERFIFAVVGRKFHLQRVLRTGVVCPEAEHGVRKAGDGDFRRDDAAGYSRLRGVEHQCSAVAVLASFGKHRAVARCPVGFADVADDDFREPGAAVHGDSGEGFHYGSLDGRTGDGHYRLPDVATAAGIVLGIDAEGLVGLPARDVELVAVGAVVGGHLVAAVAVGDEVYEVVGIDVSAMLSLCGRFPGEDNGTGFVKVFAGAETLYGTGGIKSDIAVLAHGVALHTLRHSRNRVGVGVGPESLRVGELQVLAGADTVEACHFAAVAAYQTVVYRRQCLTVDALGGHIEIDGG